MVGSFADPFSDLHENLFGGFFGVPKQKTLSTQKKCSCGYTYLDISQKGKVGCPSCYTVFKEELAPTLRSIHGTTTHTGCVPSRHRAKKERNERLKLIKKQLHEAIQREDYEAAARLRDEARALQADKEKEEN